MDIRYSVKLNPIEWLLLKRRHSVYPGFLRQNRKCTLSETTKLSMEDIRHHILQFVHGTRNLWRQRVLDKGRSGQSRISEENIN